MPIATGRILYAADLLAWQAAVEAGANAVVVGYGSYVDFAAAAAAGLISPIADAIVTACHTTLGDDGGAQYRWTAALPGHPLRVANGGSRGGYWELDEPNPHVAMAGALGDPLGADALSTNDSVPAFTALSAYLVARYAGGMIRYGMRNYYCHNDLPLGVAVGIEGPPTQGRDTRAASGIEAIEGVHSQPGLVFRSNRGLKYQDNFTAKWVTVRRHGIVAHTDLKGALDFQITFVGTGMEKVGGGAARGVTIENCNFYGFAIGLDLFKATGCRIDNLFGDCPTLWMLRQSGETCYVGRYKRKPLLTNNNAIDPKTVVVTALFDSGGQVGMTLAEDAAVLGLTTGQRVGNQKMPDAFLSRRRTVTVLSPTSIRLEGEAWDPAYASFALAATSSISFQAGCGAGITGFYNSGGKVGVQTSIDMPFVAGHFALLGCNELAPRGFHQVLTRVGARDFVLNVAWDAALSGVSLPLCELAAMPNNRRHNSVVSYWGTTEGFAAAVVKCDGIRITGSTKGGSGIYVEGDACHITKDNEGGSVGPLDLNDPDTRGVVVKQPRTVISGAFKSTGVAADIAMENKNDSVLFVGSEFVDNGQASVRLAVGRAFLLEPAVRGAGRVILNAIQSLFSLGGELRPSGITAAVSAADRQRSHWDYVDTTTRTILSTVLNFRAWVGSVDTSVGTLSGTGLAMTVPVTAPNLASVVSFAAGSTTNATPLRLTTDGAAAGAPNIGPVVDNLTGQHARAVRVEVTAERMGGASGTAGDSASWIVEVFLTRDVGAASTAVAGGGAALVPTRSRGGGSAYRLDITADTTNSGLSIAATGVATTDIQWRCRTAAL